MNFDRDIYLQGHPAIQLLDGDIVSIFRAKNTSMRGCVARNEWILTMTYIFKDI